MITTDHHAFWQTRTCDIPSYPEWLRADDFSIIRFATHFHDNVYQLGYDPDDPRPGLGQFPRDQRTLNQHSVGGRVISLYLDRDRPSPYSVTEILLNLPVVLMELAL